MSRKPRIPTDGAPPLSDNPFAALSEVLASVPPGDVASAPPEPEPTPTDAPLPKLGKKIVLRREKKGRGGKTATVLEGLQLPHEALEEMARALRRSLGCGTHVEGATIVVSGAQTERIRDWLSAHGATRIVIGN